MHTYTHHSREAKPLHTNFSELAPPIRKLQLYLLVEGIFNRSEKSLFKLQFQRRMKRSRENKAVPGEVGPGKTFLKRRVEPYAQSGQKCQETVFHGSSCHLFEQISHLTRFQQVSIYSAENKAVFPLQRMNGMMINLAYYRSIVCHVY